MFPILPTLNSPPIVISTFKTIALSISHFSNRYKSYYPFDREIDRFEKIENKVILFEGMSLMDS